MLKNELNEHSKNENFKSRVLLASNCSDCQGVPKIDGAGSFTGANNELQVMHNGVLIKRGSYHGEWMSEIISNLKGHHEPQEEKVFYEVLKKIGPGATMIELGSFWAYYSLWFQRQIPQAKSILVEPNEEKLTVGKDHFNLNGMVATFIRAFVGSASVDSASFTDWDGKSTCMRMVSIDGLRNEFNVDIVDIVHADVQGAEFDMLNGASQSLAAKKINYIFISTHGYEHERCLRFLKKYNYQIIAEHSILESCSGDGLIVAHSPNLEHFTVKISRLPSPAWKKIKYKLACIRSSILK